MNPTTRSPKSMAKKKVSPNPATGRTKAERALGKDAPKKSPAKATSLRMATPGIFNGRRGAYGRYSASPAASDVIKKTPRREK